MKIWGIVIIILSWIYAFPVRHEIVYKGGKSSLGYISEITRDSVRIQSLLGEIEYTISLDSIMYIHNMEGKLFYISTELWRFIQKSIGRGGILTTVEGEEIPFSDLHEELFMYYPQLTFYSIKRMEKRKIRLTQIHKIQIDHTISEYAARKGFYLGSGVSLFLFLIKFKALHQFYDFNKVFKEINDVYPTTITLIPITTLGWIIYDFFMGERKLVINPLRKEQPKQNYTSQSTSQ